MSKLSYDELKKAQERNPRNKIIITYRDSHGDMVKGLLIDFNRRDPDSICIDNFTNRILMTDVCAYQITNDLW